MVKYNDTLGKISVAYYGDENFWKIIYNTNNDLMQARKQSNIGPNNRLPIGLKLHIPHPEDIAP